MERRSSTSVDCNTKDSNSTNGKPEGTEYIPARCRITKPNPPKPAKNPLQFVKVGPCDLYRSAQEQLKKVEVIKKIKQEFKEDGEDWQANLDNWKSSRRKRQEHIIERVVEIRNMEQENEKSRRRSKTFSEMLEDRNRRRKLSNLTLYTEDDGNDLSDLGISTPSRKGSISGDSNATDDTNSLNNLQKDLNEPDNINSEKSLSNGNSNSNEEYTYESAIQGYKSRVKRRSFNEFPSTDSSYTSNNTSNLNKNEDRRFSLYTLQSSLNNNNSHNSTSSLNSTTTKCDVPKVDITERKQLFETGKINSGSSRTATTVPDELSHSKSIKERLKHLEKCTEESLNIKKATKLLTGDIMTVRDRLSSLVSHTTNIERNNNIPSWSSTSQLTDSNDKAMRKAQIEQNDHDQRSNSSSMISSFSHMDKGRMFHCSLDSLDIRCGDTNPDTCTLEHVQSLDGLDYCERSNYPPSGSSTELLALSQCGDTDREDSGIQTADVSCSVSQADDPDEDSDTMAAVNTVCVEQHLNHTDDQNPLKTYLSSIEYSPQESSMPTSPEVTDSTSNATTKSESSLMVEDLITCTINMNLGNKIVFDDISSDIPSVVPLDPLAPPRSVEPPKEKPPPPPVDVASDNDESTSTTDNTEHELKRLNSTKRIKNEIRNKRSSFLGIEGVSDISDLELTVSKPPDAATILQEELQLEKELYRQSQSFHQNSIDLANAHAEVESRDSGVELESRSASEQYPMSDTVDGNIKTNEEDEITKKEREIIENLEKEERWRHNYNKNRINKGPSTVLNSYYYDDNHCSPQNSTPRDEKDDPMYQDDEDVIRVERELLELEQEELERQREDMLYQNRKANLLNSVTKSGNIGILDTYIRKPGRSEYQNNNYSNYYHSTPVAAPPASAHRSCTLNSGYNNSKIAQLPVTSPPIAPPKPIRLSGSTSSDSIIVDMPNQMSRHTLHALSATPKSKLMTTDSWIHSPPSAKKTPMTLTSTHDRDYNQHWLIQEAEERRLTDRANRNLISNNNNANNNFINRHSSIEKHIPDSVVHTLTQRIQNRSNLREKSHLINRKDISVPRGSSTLLPSHDRSRPPSIPNTSMTSMPSMPSVVQSPSLAPIPSPPSVYDFHDKMLSVSGKKKCSHCGDELGRGAAMIIESLCLFYHMDCFKCCVCHVQLGDGLMGTDVRVRNHKLHCHNCYSSDDGVKFSCV